MPKTEVFVPLEGEDGNAFMIIGRVSKALKRAGLKDEAKQFSDEAFQCKSYDALLQHVMAWVETEELNEYGDS